MSTASASKSSSSPRTDGQASKPAVRTGHLERLDREKPQTRVVSPLAGRDGGKPTHSAEVESFPQQVAAPTEASDQRTLAGADDPGIARCGKVAPVVPPERTCAKSCAAAKAEERAAQPDRGKSPNPSDRGKSPNPSDRGKSPNPSDRGKSPIPSDRKKSRCGALALRACAEIKAAEEARQAEMQRIREAEAVKAQMLLDERLLRASQDQDYQQSLLTDQLKDHEARERELDTQLQSLKAKLAECERVHGHAAQRLQRFGDNPRYAEEVARASEELNGIKDEMPKVEGELAGVQDHIAHLNGLLAALIV